MEQKNPALCISQFQLRPAPPRATAGHLPALSVPGWGICKFCAAWGPGSCQPRGHSWAFDTHAVCYQNITTQRILLGKKADWLICQGQEKLKRFVKACSWFYACISSLKSSDRAHYLRYFLKYNNILGHLPLLKLLKFPTRGPKVLVINSTVVGQMFLTQWLSWQRKLRNIDDTQLGQGLSSLPVHEEGTKLPLNYSYNSISAATFNLIFIKLCALVNSIPRECGAWAEISAVLDCHFGHDMRGLRQYYEDASVKERRPLTVLSRGFALVNILNRGGTGTGLPLRYSPGMGCESFNHPSMLLSNGYLNELLKCPPSTAQPPPPTKVIYYAFYFA